MLVAFAEVRVGEPLCHEALTVFPLFCNSSGEVAYRLSDEALADQTVLVEEVSERGSVPDLLVENRGDLRVLFLEGEELVGAKQNRVLNSSVLIPAHSRIKIPVSCVEQGRWRYQTSHFSLSGSHSPSKLRRALKASVIRSLKDRRGHRSDQGAVWEEVSKLHSSHGVKSDTTAMSDAFAMYDERIGEFKEQLKYVAGASGLAVAVGDRLVAFDLFDKPSTCERVWGRLLTGMVFEAIEAGQAERSSSEADVEQLLRAAADLPWESGDAAGEGEEYRAESQQGHHGSVLAVENVMIHASVLTAM